MRQRLAVAVVQRSIAAAASIPRQHHRANLRLLPCVAVLSLHCLSLFSSATVVPVEKNSVNGRQHHFESDISAPTSTTMSASSSRMSILKHASASIARPFGDERTVNQAFPGTFGSSSSDAAAVTDPFLMLDDFAMKSDGVEEDPDKFPIDWHPHRGMDILSYLKSGIGRHGDSLGNRETFATPGMQWISVGSGIMHAEGGGTPYGELMSGFQIWVNTPAAHKMDDPKYGTEPPEAIPLVDAAEHATVRVLAGNFPSAGGGGSVTGPFKTKADVQMLDFELQVGARVEHAIPASHDTCIVYVYNGEGSVSGTPVAPKAVLLMDAASDSVRRSFELAADSSKGSPMHVMLFSGKRLNEPIVWHGPIVMNTKEEIRQTFFELQRGTFPPVKADWDFYHIDSKPSSA